jgi:hypothetical protein
MNERLNQLAEQAEPRCYERNIDWMEDYLEKFAQLIIKACVDKIQGLRMVENDETDIEDRYWNGALGHAVLEIEQHFSDDKDEQC